MRRLVCIGSFLFLLPLVSACDLMQLVQGDAVIVELVNNSDYPVNVELRIGDNQYVLQDILEEFGNKRNYTVPAGAMTTFFEPCDNLQAIMITKADLSLVGSVGPSASTNILRDGGDFGCGDRIIYTFDHSAVIADFDIETDVLD